MKEQYTVQQLQHQEFSKGFPFVQNAILGAGYKYWLDYTHGPYQIETRFGNCAMCYSNYFNSAATAFLRATRDTYGSIDMGGIIEHVLQNESIFPNQVDMKIGDLIQRMSEEFVFIGTEKRGVIAPMLTEIKKNNYVKYGLLHILQRHYEGIGDLGFEKAPSLFPQDSTINEILGALVKTVVEGEVESSNESRVCLTVPIKMGPSQSSGYDPYLLVIEKSAYPAMFTAVTFYPNTK